MAGKSTATETPVTPEAPAPAEPTATAPAGESGQEIVANQEIESLRKQIADAAAAMEALSRQRDDAVANALRADAQYKGLQNQTTKTLQKAAQDRRELELARMQAAEVGDIKSLLNTLASKVLDEDEAKQLQWKQKELELQRREAALTAAANAPKEEPVAEPQQYTTPEDEKAQFLSYYFPGVAIDPKDPNIDWGVGATSTQEAFRRFTTSVLKIKDTQESSKANNAVAELQKQAAAQLEAMKQQISDLASKSQEEIAAAKTAAAEEARKEAEKRLRAMGADVSGTPTSDGSGRKTLGQQVNEVLDDSLLSQGPKGVAEYNRRVEAIKKQVREGFQL